MINEKIALVHKEWWKYCLFQQKLSEYKFQIGIHYKMENNLGTGSNEIQFLTEIINKLD